jgi:hypothetical protein
MQIDGLFLLRQEIQEQRGKPAVFERLGHRPVAPAETAASAAVREHHQPDGSWRDRQIAIDQHRSGPNLHGVRPSGPCIGTHDQTPVG